MQGTMYTLTRYPYCDTVIPTIKKRCPSCDERVRPLIGRMGIFVLLVSIIAMVFVIRMLR